MKECNMDRLCAIDTMLLGMARADSFMRHGHFLSAHRELGKLIKDVYADESVIDLPAARDIAMHLKSVISYLEPVLGANRELQKAIVATRDIKMGVMQSLIPDDNEEAEEDPDKEDSTADG